jgi:CDP-paratose 2-epimerase
VKVLITGSCGFIGCNTAARSTKIGYQVTLYDNLSRVGADSNLDWLRHHWQVEFIYGDVRNLGALCDLLKSRHFDVVIHLASQVAVTALITDPEHDKVYGKLGSLKPREGVLRYDLPHLPDGVNESQPLDFHSPYGCSKRAADQYVNDYARVFQLRTVKPAPVVHLRLPPIRHRRSGVGRLVFDRTLCRPKRRYLRRWQTGARYPVHR